MPKSLRHSGMGGSDVVTVRATERKDSIRINRYTLLLVTGVIQLAAAFSRTLSIILLPGILAEFSSPELAEQKQLGSTSGLDRPLLLACGWSHTRNPCAMGQGLSQSVQCCQQEQLKRCDGELRTGSPHFHVCDVDKDECLQERVYVASWTESQSAHLVIDDRGDEPRPREALHMQTLSYSPVRYEECDTIDTARSQDRYSNALVHTARMNTRRQLLDRQVRKLQIREFRVSIVGFKVDSRLAAEAHPADAQKLQEPYVTEWPARTQLLGGTTLRVLEAARVLRDMVPRLTGEMLPATVSMLQAIEAWQQAMFGGPEDEVFVVSTVASLPRLAASLPLPLVQPIPVDVVVMH
ncbi:hypothetical protein AK812_SmicGene36325 [Symbiodinium microadriaticum]|uniref:Uncharacterized protein n=1 Tax=Symbiodinium microadriaticum TaxID=2951 RepID=A0A1Q9CJ49_SYMMI|nr:hypothetical protein AK812_SmicGene36325 [Symbiodinium microadriaticum]